MTRTKKKLSWFACRIHDEDLANRCDKIADMSQAERKRVDAALVEYVSNGHLGKASRDDLICIAKARALLAATEMKPKPRNANAVLNPGDPFSTAWTRGTDAADRLLSLYTARDRDGNLAIKPPPVRWST